MKYAARAMQLARNVSGADLEPEYKKILGQALSNISGFETGSNVYDNMVKPSVVDLNRVTAHYAISSIFKEFPDTATIFSYTVKREANDIKEAGIQKLAMGRVRVRSDLTWDEAIMSFAVVYFDGHYISGSVQPFAGGERYEAAKMEIDDAFAKSDIPEVIRRMDKNFGDHNYGMWHLFKDAQNMIFGQILKPQLQEISALFKQIYDHHYPAMQVMRNIGVAMPPVFGDIRKFVLNFELEKGIEDMDASGLRKLAEEIAKWPVDLDPALTLTAGRQVETLMKKFKERPDDMALLETINSFVKTLNDIRLEPNLWKSQNILFGVSRQQLGGMKERAEKGDTGASRWLELFQGLENYMHVRT